MEAKALENLHSPHQQLHAVHNEHGTEQSLSTSHFEGHGRHLHMAPAHDGHRRGSDEVSVPHQTPKGTSEPLSHQKSASRWLPPFELNGDEQYKRILENDRLNSAERLQAARNLVDDGVHSLAFRDHNGHDHDFHIQLLNSGRVRVSDDDSLILGDRHVASRPHHRRPSGLSEIAEGQYHYKLPSGGSSIEAGPTVDPHVWNGVQNGDGSVTIGFSGCAVDTDGLGASRHGEDIHRRSCTSLTRADGRYLDTDKDNFVVLAPSVAAAYGIHIGDLGWLVRKDNGQAVPVVFGDTGHEGRRSAEASIAALKELGFSDVNGNNGVTGGRFEIVLSPGSGNGRGDIARDPQAMADRLSQHGFVASAE